MGKAQFHVSADVLALSVRNVIDFPWPEGTQIVEEDESEWHSKRRLRVVIEHPDIPETNLSPLWCRPVWRHDDSGNIVFVSWDFQEDW